MSDPSLPRMLTFAPMVDSETTRLVCRWYGIDYVEEDHLFGWASLLTLPRGGYGQTPFIYGAGLKLSGPRAVVDRFEPKTALGRRLLPTGPEAAGVEADWDLYHGVLSGHVAVYAYYHLLPARDLMTRVFVAPLPAGEAKLTPGLYPLLKWLFTTLLRLTPERAAAAGDYIRTVFAAVDRRLADGRTFLAGERLTLGDIGFAGAAAPLLQPVGYGTLMPDVAAMPPAIRDTIETLRQHPAAHYVQRVYSAVHRG